MPGPNSQPWAVANGFRVVGKTALRRAKLRSSQGAYRDGRAKEEPQKSA